MCLRKKSRLFYFGDKTLKLISSGQIFVSKRVFFQRNRKSKFLKIAKNIEKLVKNGSTRNLRKKFWKQTMLRIWGFGNIENELLWGTVVSRILEDKSFRGFGSWTYCQRKHLHDLGSKMFCIVYGVLCIVRCALRVEHQGWCIQDWVTWGLLVVLLVHSPRWRKTAR